MGTPPPEVALMAGNPPHRCPDCIHPMKHVGIHPDTKASMWWCPECLTEWHRQRRPQSTMVKDARRGIFHEPDKT